jgi:hypothetical protein
MWQHIARIGATLLTIVGFAVIARLSPAFGQVRPTVRQTTTETKATPADENEAIIMRRLPEVNFNAVALSDAIDFMRNASGANIFVNWKSLNKVGITKMSPVTARLKDIRFDKAMRIILDEAAGGKCRIVFITDRGVVEIAAPDRGFQLLDVTSYDLGPLLRGHPNLATQLPKKVMSSVEAASWIENGGSAGMIKLDSDKLYVTQTPENQKAIADLLEKWKRKPPSD